MSEPSRALCRLVDIREQECCAKCGVWIGRVSGARHHRFKRREGGHSASILILLCSGCHAWAHGHPVAARAVGLIIPASGRIRPSDVPSIPVKTFWGWRLHDDQGGQQTIPEALALELLDSFGMLGAAA